MPKLRNVSAVGDVKGVDFKAQSPGISGAVLGVKCTDRGCQRVGLGDVKVLVTGTQSDGISVSDTAVSDAKKGCR